MASIGFEGMFVLVVLAQFDLFEELGPVLVDDHGQTLAGGQEFGTSGVRPAQKKWPPHRRRDPFQVTLRDFRMDCRAHHIHNRMVVEQGECFRMTSGSNQLDFFDIRNHEAIQIHN